MKKIKFLGIYVFILLIYFTNISCDNNDSNQQTVVDGSGGGGASNSITLTVGARRDLNAMLPEGKTATSWSSGAASVATVTTNGIVQAVGITRGGSSAFASGPGTGSATITANLDDGETFSITVNTTTAGTEDIMSLPPLKDQIARHFPLAGNIFNPGDVTGGLNPALARHYNILTHENNMKPQYLATGISSSPSLNSGGIDTAVGMINAARNTNIQIVGHTLLWHSQNPSSVSGDLAAMQNYILQIAGHSSIRGRIHTWDVLNEVFPDSGYTASSDWKTVMRGNNPWFAVQKSDFVYEGFLAARKADPNAILYYNDYNTDQVAKATMIRDMVVAVNNRYLTTPGAKPAGEDPNRLLIEGIGMQEHHNLSVTPQSIRNTLTMFRNMSFTGSDRKIKIAVSELDVLGNASYQAFNSSTGAGTNRHAESAVTNDQIIRQAERYAEYVAVYIEFKDIIERISLWGVQDNNSWRSGGLPLLFDHEGKAKPAYYYFVNALE